MYTTLLVSVLATVISTVVGTITSVGLYGMKKRWRDPPVLSRKQHPHHERGHRHRRRPVHLLFVAAIRPGGTTLSPSPLDRGSLSAALCPGWRWDFCTLLLAHLSFDIPYVILNVLPKLRQMDGSLIDAAQDLGCTWPQAFWKVVVPEIKPGIVSGALIAFTMSIDDFVISYFTAGSASTLSIEIYGMVRRRVSPELNAVSTLLFVVVLILLVIINVREARQEKAAQRRRP